MPRVKSGLRGSLLAAPRAGRFDLGSFREASAALVEAPGSSPTSPFDLRELPEMSATRVGLVPRAPGSFAARGSSVEHESFKHATRTASDRRLPGSAI
jgi:hypothetical protein